MNKCYKPVAAGPEGVAVCILEEGHEGTCNGGAIERRIGESFAASRLAKEMEYAEQYGWKPSWSDLHNEQLGLDLHE